MPRVKGKQSIAANKKTFSVTHIYNTIFGGINYVGKVISCDKYRQETNTYYNIMVE